jgi:hypothetical protein
LKYCSKRVRLRFGNRRGVGGRKKEKEKEEWIAKQRRSTIETSEADELGQKTLL